MAAIWSGTKRRFIRGHSVTLKSAAAETSSTDGTAVEFADNTSVALTLAVSAHGGTNPTLSVRVDGSADGTNWFTIGTFFNGGFQFAGVAAGFVVIKNLIA